MLSCAEAKADHSVGWSVVLGLTVLFDRILVLNIEPSPKEKRIAVGMRINIQTTLATPTASIVGSFPTIIHIIHISRMPWHQKLYPNLLPNLT